MTLQIFINLVLPSEGTFKVEWKAIIFYRSLLGKNLLTIPKKSFTGFSCR